MNNPLDDEKSQSESVRGLVSSLKNYPVRQCYLYVHAPFITNLYFNEQTEQVSQDEMDLLRYIEQNKINKKDPTLIYLTRKELVKRKGFFRRQYFVTMKGRETLEGKAELSDDNKKVLTEFRRQSGTKKGKTKKEIATALKLKQVNLLLCLS